MPIRIVRAGSSLAFPDFEDGEKLPELVDAIAAALGTHALRPVGSPLEWLISFAGLPEEVKLWWDGFTCELGTTAREATMDDIGQQLMASGGFELSS